MMDRRTFLIRTSGMLGGAVCAAGAAEDTPPFAFHDDGSKLTVLERGRPVLAYRYAEVAPPEGVAQKFRRACYIHPLHGVDGEVVTEDFPADHYHHRGVFWAWPNCHVGDRKLNVWELDGARQVFHRWIVQQATPTAARIEVQNAWRFDEDEFAPILEQVRFVVRPIESGTRAIDFELECKNVTDGPVEFKGSSAPASPGAAVAKGYGGFCFRPDASRKPFTFTTVMGVMAVDAMSCETPWADISWGGPHKAGVAIFQHPSNPGFPHPGWILRHYGFLGASWPHNDPHSLNAGESFTLRYRLLVHAGNAGDAEVAELAKHYTGTASAGSA